MDLSALRALVTDVNFGTHGVPATVTVPDGAAVAATVIWSNPMTLALPAGMDLRRASAKQSLAVRRSELPQLPRGSIVLAPERTGGAVKRWRVDAVETIETDYLYAVVVLDPEL